MPQRSGASVRPAGGFGETHRLNCRGVGRLVEQETKRPANFSAGRLSKEIQRTESCPQLRGFNWMKKDSPMLRLGSLSQPFGP